jgi:uncharacterized protein (TIGR02246 family)
VSAPDTADAIVAAIIAQWSNAFTRLDADTLAALYSDNALFYGSVPTLFRKRAGVAAYFNGLTRWPSPSVAFSDLVTAAVGDDVISMAGRATFLVTPEATPLVVKITWVIVREHGAWLIASHHVSPTTPLIRRD